VNLLTKKPTGPAIYVYGATGPAYGAYEVVLDNEVTLNGTAFRTAPTTGSHLLVAHSSLTYGNHQIVLRNLGASTLNLGSGTVTSGNALLLDYIQSTIQLAPAGQAVVLLTACSFFCFLTWVCLFNRATVKNHTYEETSPAIKYSGVWGNNTSPFFSGGGSTYTEGDGASFEMTFQGTQSSFKKIQTFLIDGFFPQQDRRSMSWATRKTIIAATQSFSTPRLTNTMVPQVVVEHSD